MARPTGTRGIPLFEDGAFARLPLPHLYCHLPCVQASEANLEQHSHSPVSGPFPAKELRPWKLYPVFETFQPLRLLPACLHPATGLGYRLKEEGNQLEDLQISAVSNHHKLINPSLPSGGGPGITGQKKHTWLNPDWPGGRKPEHCLRKQHLLIALLDTETAEQVVCSTPQIFQRDTITEGLLHVLGHVPLLLLSRVPSGP
ncbi:hypothetical protein B0I37DRAFT_206986 [Chaetomium sp. MPI-CAGE-AT-0009]|nr:hypothetical protein B0I37DRAFT_206986 [Chaetomium sp. MPI-CAGE-AT-0009]